MAGKNKSKLTKTTIECVYRDGELWTIQYGQLKRHKGNPGKTQRLFQVVGEKLPYDALATVRDHVKENGYGTDGVYVAHDSMGFPRYIGRGAIFNRLKARKDAQVLELSYFSFYVVSEKKHEREIETLLIRAAGPLLEFNTRKKRVSIKPGNIRDYEAGTTFYERQYKKGA
ncbi:hypothetical protein [Solimonas flava]|uniref:hypothetical protein n=1 Tax=Solimonas flava TaxID=415849 RepID=UPI0012B66376|nr:hypothetical protein [Solimonas flava]